MSQTPAPIPAPLPPIPDDGSKPAITHAMASFHAERAAQVAGIAAQQEGVPEATAKTLLFCGSVMCINGVIFEPLDARFLLMLPLLQRWTDKTPPFNDNGLDVLPMCYALAEPTKAWEALNQSDGAELATLVFNWSAAFDLPALKKLGKLITDQLAALNAEGETAAADLGNA